MARGLLTLSVALDHVQCSADADEVSTVGSRAGVEKKSGQQKPAWLGYEAGASQQHGAMYILLLVF